MTNLIIHQRLRYFAFYTVQFTSILLSFFFLFLVIFNNFFTSPVDNENARLRLALAIPIGVPITVGNDAIEMLPLVANKTNKDLSK